MARRSASPRSVVPRVRRIWTPPAEKRTCHAELPSRWNRAKGSMGAGPRSGGWSVDAACADEEAAEDARLVLAMAPKSDAVRSVRLPISLPPGLASCSSEDNKLGAQR